MHIASSCTEPVKLADVYGWQRILQTGMETGALSTCAGYAAGLTTCRGRATPAVLPPCSFHGVALSFRRADATIEISEATPVLALAPAEGQCLHVGKEALQKHILLHDPLRYYAHSEKIRSCYHKL